MEQLKYPERWFGHLISMPFIWGLIIPLAISDMFTEIYHRICFPLYGLSFVKRSDYIKIDRHKLKYLTFPQKLGCIYCGYANGAIHYWSEIAGRTEKYWCGIMHQKKKGFIPPRHHKDFAEYGNETAFRKKYGK